MYILYELSGNSQFSETAATNTERENVRTELVNLQSLITETSEQNWPLATEQIEFVFGIKKRSKIMFIAFPTLTFISKQKFRLHLCSLQSTLARIH